MRIGAKRTTTGALLVIGALVAAACGDGVLPSGPDFDAQFAHRGSHGNTVEVCHKGKTINVNANAVAGHVRGHSDTAGSCDAAPDPTITVISGEFIPPVFMRGFVTVEFSSSDCSNGREVLYQLVGADDGKVELADFLATGDGPHTMSDVFITPDDVNTQFQVRGDCDGDGGFDVWSDLFPPFP